MNEETSATANPMQGKLVIPIRRVLLVSALFGSMAATLAQSEATMRTGCRRPRLLG